MRAAEVLAGLACLVAFAVAAGAVVWVAWDLWAPLPRPRRTPGHPYAGAGNYVDARSRRAR